MANTNDVIVLDAEKYPQVAVWGEKLGTQLGLEYFHLADEYFDYIPQHINHLRIDSKTATFGHKYWGEYRSQQSEYGESEEGTTQKDKVDVDREIVTNYTIPFMKAVLRLKIQEIYEKRYNTLRTKYSVLEDATWGDQLAESQAYLQDDTTAVSLIDRLASIRGLTTSEFAAKVVEKQKEWKGKLFDLAVGEQTVIGKLNDCVNMADMNVFLEDYFGLAMPGELCLDYNRCELNGDGLIVRKEPLVYGLKF